MIHGAELLSKACLELVEELLAAGKGAFDGEFDRRRPTRGQLFGGAFADDEGALAHGRQQQRSGPFQRPAGQRGHGRVLDLDAGVVEQLGGHGRRVAVPVGPQGVGDLDADPPRAVAGRFQDGLLCAGAGQGAGRLGADAVDAVLHQLLELGLRLGVAQDAQPGHRRKTHADLGVAEGRRRGTVGPGRGGGPRGSPRRRPAPANRRGCGGRPLGAAAGRGWPPRRATPRSAPPAACRSARRSAAARPRRRRAGPGRGPARRATRRCTRKPRRASWPLLSCLPRTDRSTRGAGEALRGRRGRRGPRRPRSAWPGATGGRARWPPAAGRRRGRRIAPSRWRRCPPRWGPCRPAAAADRRVARPAGSRGLPGQAGANGRARARSRHPAAGRLEPTGPRPARRDRRRWRARWPPGPAFAGRRPEGPSLVAQRAGERRSSRGSRWPPAR